MLVKTDKQKAKLLVGYRRVSTQMQGKSGLGLEAQDKAIADYAASINGAIVKVYEDVETGKRNDRAELQKAIAHAKCQGATLVIAKLDRLARNVAFVSALMESGVDFVCCDNPHANRLTIHILAAVAENEVVMISERTKAALAAYKARGGKLGASLPQCRNLSKEAARQGAIAGGVAVHKAALAAYEHVLPMMREMRQAGHTLQQIADKLNADGYSTRRGKQWSHVQVKLVLERA